MTWFTKLYTIFLPILTVNSAHYVSANLYTRVCASSGVIGFLTSFLTAGSPMCNSLITVINSTSNSYAVVITSLVSGLIGAISFTT